MVTPPPFSDVGPLLATPVHVYVVLGTSARARSPLGDAVENFLRREDAERFLAEVRGDDPELAAFLRVEERKLEAGGGNRRTHSSTTRGSGASCMQPHEGARRAAR
jgi:hypothetical protein